MNFSASVNISRLQKDTKGAFERSCEQLILFSAMTWLNNGQTFKRCLHPPGPHWAMVQSVLSIDFTKRTGFWRTIMGKSMENYDRFPLGVCMKSTLSSSPRSLSGALECPSLPRSPKPRRCQRTWNKPIARRCRQMRIRAT